MWRRCILPFLLLAGHSLGAWSASDAQVFEVSGGSSSLYQANGAQVAVHGAGYTVSTGVGWVAGQLTGGIAAEKRAGQKTYSAGTMTIPMDLPTDIFSAGHVLSAVGLSVRSESAQSTVFGFAGGTSRNLFSPYVDGTVFEKPAAMFLLHQKLDQEWTLSSIMLAGPGITILNGLQWQPAPGVQMAVTGGVGSGEGYGAVSLSVTRPLMDVKAAYINAGNTFRRADVDAPISSEPVRENLTITLRPERWASVSFTRQNFSTPVSESGAVSTDANELSTLNEISGNIEVAGCSISASGFRSSYESSGDVAISLSASRQITRRLRVQENYLAAHPDDAPASSSWISGVQEVLTPRWTLSESVTRSNGQSTLGVGGSFLSNFATISADYETYYIPTRPENPFEQALLLNANVRLPANLMLTGGTFVAPDGRLLYTAGVKTLKVRSDSGATVSVASHFIGAMLVQGRVVDLLGGPVMGAALRIDQSIVYSDSNGYFCLREFKAHTHTLQVMLDGFLDGLGYRVVSAPPVIRSSTEVNTETAIVVERTAGASGTP